MSYVDVVQNTATWLTFIALDSGTDAPRTGITFGQIAVNYQKEGATTLTAKSLLVSDFREIGLGVYEILFSAAELNTLGMFLYVVNSNGTLAPPAIKQYVDQANVQAATVPSTAITLATNIITGNVVDLNGVAIEDAAVSARVLEMPAIAGTYPNIGGVSTDMVSTRTDSNGFFSLTLIQGSVVDITIPRVNYRRTLTVPNNATDVLFLLP